MVNMMVVVVVVTVMCVVGMTGYLLGSRYLMMMVMMFTVLMAISTMV